MKLRPASSARRARRSYLTAVTFRQHFSGALKIIRLLNKRGFSFRWLRLVSCGCDGARVNPGVARSCAEGEKGRSRIRYENKGEKYSPIIISAKKTLQTNQAIKQITPKTIFLIFLKTGLLQYNTTNKGSRPEIQNDPGEGGREESRRSSTPPTRDSAPCQHRSSIEINFRRGTTSSKIRNHRC